MIIGYFQITDWQIAIVEKSFWDLNHCLNSDDEDPFLDDNVPDGFYALSDSIYEYEGEVEEARQVLINASFEEKELFNV
jgi:hypothetical protein